MTTIQELIDNTIDQNNEFVLCPTATWNALKEYVDELNRLQNAFLDTIENHPPATTIKTPPPPATNNTWQVGDQIQIWNDETQTWEPHNTNTDTRYYITSTIGKPDEPKLHQITNQHGTHIGTHTPQDIRHTNQTKPT